MDPEGPYEGVPGGGRFSVPGSDSQQLPCQQPPWGQLTAVNVNTGEFAWRVPLGVTDSLPAGQAEDRTSGERRHDRDGRGTGVRGGDRRRSFPRVRCEERQGAVDLQARRGGRGDTDDVPGKDGKQYVVITSTGGGFFGNPVTDDSIMAFALEGK